MNLSETFTKLALEQRKLAVFIKGSDHGLVGYIVKKEDDFIVLKRLEGGQQFLCHIPISSIGYFQVR